MSKFKARKTRHLRGRKTGYGAKKKHRGAGSRGGTGKAGLHKHKWSWTVTNEPDHFKKPSLKPKPKMFSVMNLWQVNDIAAKQDLKELNFPGVKILGAGEITKPLKIKAAAFSESASRKIKEAGGTAESLAKPKAEKIKTAEAVKK